MLLSLFCIVRSLCFVLERGFLAGSSKTAALVSESTSSKTSRSQLIYGLSLHSPLGFGREAICNFALEFGFTSPFLAWPGWESATGSGFPRSFARFAPRSSCSSAPSPPGTTASSVEALPLPAGGPGLSVWAALEVARFAARLLGGRSWSSECSAENSGWDLMLRFCTAWRKEGCSETPDSCCGEAPP